MSHDLKSRAVPALLAAAITIAVSAGLAMTTSTAHAATLGGTTRVSVPQPAPQSDIALGDRVETTTPYCLGCNPTFGVQVSNQGYDDSGPFYVHVVGADVDRLVYVPSLRWGESATVPLGPASWCNCRPVVTVVADYFHQVNDPNRSNNFASYTTDIDAGNGGRYPY